MPKKYEELKALLISCLKEIAIKLPAVGISSAATVNSIKDFFTKPQQEIDQELIDYATQIFYDLNGVHSEIIKNLANELQNILRQISLNEPPSSSPISSSSSSTSSSSSSSAISPRFFPPPPSRSASATSSTGAFTLRNTGNGKITTLAEGMNSLAITADNVNSNHVTTATTSSLKVAARTLEVAWGDRALPKMMISDNSTSQSSSSSSSFSSSSSSSNSSATAVVSHSQAETIINIATTGNVTNQLPPEEKLIPPSSLWHVPPVNQNFTGRTELLKQMADVLDSPQPVILTALKGLGGVGKSHLATQFVYQNHPQKYSQVYWLRAESSSQLFFDYQDLAEQLNLPIENLKPEQIRDVIKSYLEKNPGWLLVYDNAPNYEEIKDFLPRSWGKVLVTSRHTQWPGQTPIAVGVFTETEARDYIHKITEITNEEDKVNELMQVLGRLPLALAQACAYISESNKYATPMTIAGYMQEYQKERAKYLADETLPTGDNHEPVMITWNITMQAIEKKSPTAIKLLQYCSYLNPEEIQYDLLWKITEVSCPQVQQKQRNDDLILICKYSMLQNNPQMQMVSMHPLVKEVMQLQTGHERRYEELELLSSLMNELYPSENNTFEDRQQIKQFLPHLNSLSKIAEICFNEIDETRKIEFLRTIFGLLKLLKSGYECLGDLRKLWELTPRLATIVKTGANVMGGAYEGMGLTNPMPDAMAMVTSLPALNTILAQPPAGESNNNYLPQELQKSAETTLLVLERIYGEGSTEIVKPLRGLAFINLTYGNTAEAKRGLLRAMNILKQNNQCKSVEMAKILDSLGDVYLRLDEIIEAQASYEEAIEIFDKNGSQKEVAKLLVSLGKIYGSQNDLNRQKKLLERSLQILLDTYSEEEMHIDLLDTLKGLGKVCLTLGETTKAIGYIEQALKIERSFVSDHNSAYAAIANTLFVLASAYLKSGDLAKAQSFCLESYQIFLNHPNYGPRNSNTESAKYLLDKIQELSNEFKKSIELANFLKNKYMLEDISQVSRETGFHLAVNNNSIDDISSFLTLDVSVDAQDPTSKKTALHRAVINEHIPCIELLLKAGARSNIPDATGKTAFEYAEKMTDQRILNLLIRQIEADILQEDEAALEQSSNTAKMFDNTTFSF